MRRRIQISAVVIFVFFIFLNFDPLPQHMSPRVKLCRLDSNLGVRGLRLSKG